MKKALPEVNLAQLLITETKARAVFRVKSHRVPFLAAGGPGADADAGFRRQCGRVDERAARLGIEPIDPLVRSVQVTSQNGLP